MHQYYDGYKDNAGDFLARSLHMDAFIKSVASICDAVKAKKHSKKTVNLAFDEWNIWYFGKNDAPAGWKKAPHLLEDVYNFGDALLVGCMLMTLQNNCDRVKIACMAQLVNVIAPIMTEDGGKAWAQTIFYPYMYASKYGRGKTLKSVVNCEKYSSGNMEVPFIETSVINNEEKRELTVFAVNRSMEDSIELSLNLGGFENAQMIEHIELYCDNLKEINTKDAQNVKPTVKEVSNSDEIKLNPKSWNMIRFKY